MSDPYEIEKWETLPELLKRVADEYGIRARDLYGETGNRKPYKQAVRDFCYRAYKTQRYSHTYIARFLKINNRRAVQKRIRSHCDVEGIEYPHWREPGLNHPR
jgi:hypothetical protein